MNQIADLISGCGVPGSGQDEGLGEGRGCVLAMVGLHDGEKEEERRKQEEGKESEKEKDGGKEMSSEWERQAKMGRREKNNNREE